MSRAGVLEMTKHHAAGNDFLVLIDLDGRRPLSADEARAICDRHRGVGADGILRVLAGTSGAQVTMDLRNADGGVAEMSGNGIRCLVQALLDADGTSERTEVSVATLAGVRLVDHETRGPGLGFSRVEMGEATLGPEVGLHDMARVLRARTVDVGNPHIVLVCSEVWDEDLAEAGPRLSRAIPGGTNVEFAREGPRTDSVVLRVYERGVGETLACGTGACAAAAVMHDWGLVSSEVEVSLPGGTLEVRITPSHVELGGPTRKVADVSVKESDLAELVGELVEAGTVEAEGAESEMVGRQ